MIELIGMRRVAVAAIAICVCTAPLIAPAQDYPAKPVRIFVPQDSPIKDVRDFVALARARPGEVTVGNYGQ